MRVHTLSPVLTLAAYFAVVLCVRGIFSREYPENRFFAFGCLVFLGFLLFAGHRL